MCLQAKLRTQTLTVIFLPKAITDFKQNLKGLINKSFTLNPHSIFKRNLLTTKPQLNWSNIRSKFFSWLLCIKMKIG